MVGNLNFIDHISVPQHVLQKTRAFMREKGSAGFEGLAFWIGERQEPGRAKVTRVYIPPEQIARRTAFGVSVTLPPEGHTALINSINNHEIILVKLHSHPREAFLSDTDRKNHVFQFEGAWQIIVPDFAERPLNDLAHCCVMRFEKGAWRPFSRLRIREIFTVLP
ncbi:MAG: hypothetical protein ACYCX4_00500 [Bacillota bacterium]